MLILISGCLVVAAAAWAFMYGYGTAGTVALILKMIFRTSNPTTATGNADARRLPPLQPRRRARVLAHRQPAHGDGQRALGDHGQPGRIYVRVRRGCQQLLPGLPHALRRAPSARGARRQAELGLPMARQVSVQATALLTPLPEPPLTPAHSFSSQGSSTSTSRISGMRHCPSLRGASSSSRPSCHSLADTSSHSSASTLSARPSSSTLASRGTPRAPRGV